MPKDGEQLKLMLANLDTQEDGLLQLFRGTSSKETHVLTFDITPTKDVEKQVLFNFSKYLGIVDNDDPAGTPAYFSVKDLKTLPAVSVNPNAKAKKENEDLRYIVPSRAEIKVFNDSQEFISQSFPMAQFGRVEHLGGELFNKKNTTSVQLDPTTGGISKIKAEALTNKSNLHHGTKKRRRHRAGNYAILASITVGVTSQRIQTNASMERNCRQQCI